MNASILGLTIRLSYDNGTPYSPWRLRLLGLAARLLRIPLQVNTSNNTN